MEEMTERRAASSESSTLVPFRESLVVSLPSKGNQYDTT